MSGTISISLSDEVAIFLVFDIGILRKSDSAVLECNGFTESFYYTVDVCLYIVKLKSTQHCISIINAFGCLQSDVFDGQASAFAINATHNAGEVEVAIALNGHIFTISAFKTYSNKARCGQFTFSLDDNGRLIFSKTDRINIIVGCLACVFNDCIIQCECAVVMVPDDASALDIRAVEMSVSIGAHIANGNLGNCTECRYK